MKSQTLPTKRRPASKGIIRRLSAKTKSRKQRASAATANDFDMEEGNSKISRALTIIFMIHVVAIGLIFIHHQFLDGRTGTSKATSTQSSAKSKAAAAAAAEDLSPLSSGESPYIVKSGDTYKSIAQAYGVHVNDLRALNQEVAMQTGLILKIPAKRVIVAKPNRVIVTTPVEGAAAAVVEPEPRVITPARDEGLVQAIDFKSAPKAQLVEAVNLSSDRTYIVQAGDSIYRIANRFKVDQKLLMEMNGIKDARKMRTGMKLKIP